MSPVPFFSFFFSFFCGSGVVFCCCATPLIDLGSMIAVAEERQLVDVVWCLPIMGSAFTAIGIGDDNCGIYDGVCSIARKSASSGVGTRKETSRSRHVFVLCHILSVRNVR